MASKGAPGASQGPTRMSIDALLNPSGSDQGSNVLHYTHENHYQQPYPHHHHYRYHPQTDEEKYREQYREQYHEQYRHGRPSSEEEHLGSSRHRSESTHSSPGPYRRQRFPSVSSGSSTVPERRRPPRPKYDEEEMYFIWYHRVDLRQEWKEVRESFNAQFPTRQRSGFQGIQCKYYRFIKENKCPTLREQRRQREGGPGGSPTGTSSMSSSSGLGTSGLSDSSPAYGVVQWTKRWYPWMREPPMREPPMRRYE